jgi:GntR family transcriptional regulator
MRAVSIFERGGMGHDVQAGNDPQPSSLRRRSARALHEQLTDRLRCEYIATYRAGDQIPTEEEIQREHGVSRVTVRRAIQTLVERGVLIRRQGKGTFVAGARPRIIYPLDRFGPFMETLAAAGELFRTTLLDVRWVENPPAPDGLGSGRRLVYERLYETADGTPHALLRIRLPADLGERIDRDDAAAMGIYQILRKRFAIEPVRAQFEISSELPAVALARKLRVSPSTPLLILDRRSFDRRGAVVEETTHYLLPEFYKLQINVGSAGGGGLS